MTPANSENRDTTDLMVHAMIGRLFDEPEPLHRTDLADGAIAQGMAVSRRRGLAVAGATLSVVAVIGGVVAMTGGASPSVVGGDWSINTDSTAQIAPQAYEDSGPTYADRQREIVQQLPSVFRPLLPAGVTVSPNQMQATGVSYTMTGDYVPAIVVRSGSDDYLLRFDNSDNNAGYTDAFARTSAPSIAVAGGTIRVAVVQGGTESPKHQFTAWYEFKPTGSKQVFRFYLYGSGSATPISSTAFKKMVESPAFAKLRQLLDPSVPASADAVRQRYATEAKINAEAQKVLPPGFRLKFNPGAPGALELVGPGGVNTFQWFSLLGKDQQISCPAQSLCFAPYSGVGLGTKVGPDGKARLGVYGGWTGKSADSSVVIDVFGESKLGESVEPTQMGKPFETAPQGPGLTPQQAMAIVKAPGAAKVIGDVAKLAALY
ncbi:hypothetical protein [Catenulispora rubra]|uniref:hypothetical protein n=1 Tax=Catenulispora rubra TaxID=280293 RepID=UPI00189278F4|nr:hypothetical protein [Catenulispora rubra]